jgi:lipopolysaccharide transport system permease protein
MASVSASACRLLLGLVARDLSARWPGVWSAAGIGLAAPLVLAAAYALASGALLGGRWPGAEGPLGLAVAVLAGSAVFQMVAEIVGRSPATLAEAPQFVRLAGFPLPILPLVVVGSALVQVVPTLLVLAAGAVWVHGTGAWRLVVVPCALLPIVLWGCGVAWTLAVLGVYLRRHGPATALCLHVAFFASPVMYPPEALPQPWGDVMACNPLAPPIAMLRAACLGGPLPWLPVAADILAGACMAGLGWMLLKRCRKDVVESV